MDQKDGKGSIWNINNWHWENKNYTKEAEELIRKKFSDLKFTRENIDFTITKITSIKGNAEINIRKGKEIVVFEYELNLEFRGESESDECEGKVEINEINESDLDFNIVSVNMTKNGNIGHKCRNIMKKNFRDEVIKLVKNLKDEILELAKEKNREETSN
jgi:activator of HSP90 ATPase